MAQSTQYVCVEFLQPVGRGAMSCKTWQALDNSNLSNSSLPFTKEEADQITIAICGILVLVWGIRQARKLIR